MAKLLATIRGIITRLVFGCHAIVAIWQVTIFKKDMNYWFLALPTLLLIVEGVFTLTIKDNQEWKWFCPSVFVYLGGIVPAIWVLELHKVEKRLLAREEQFNLTSMSGVDMRELSKMLGGKVQLPNIPFSTETWVTLIEQFLMLILIVGRWLLPKGDLTRDQLSQLLLVYIGTAADIIEFFDSFKDDKIVSEPLLVILILAIWSWSLLQFTVVLTATKSRKSRVSANGTIVKKSASTKTFCWSIDVCAIVMNIALQDAPFLTFRLLIIFHYEIVSYMNVFFTCKNTLVILLQIYRLYVVHSETNKKKDDDDDDDEDETEMENLDRSKGNSKGKRKSNRAVRDSEMGNIAIITDPIDLDRTDNNRNILFKALVVKNRGVLKVDVVKLLRETTEHNIVNETEQQHKRRSKGKKSEKATKSKVTTSKKSQKDERTTSKGKKARRYSDEEDNDGDSVQDIVVEKSSKKKRTVKVIEDSSESSDSESGTRKDKKGSRRDRHDESTETTE